MSAKAIPAPYDNSLSHLKAVVSGEIQPDGLSSLDTNVIVTEILDAARRSGHQASQSSCRTRRSSAGLVLNNEPSGDRVRPTMRTNG